MSSIAQLAQFKCFRHPGKKVEAICTEPFCNGYRFFCVQCFFEQSSHFISHKQTIIEISQVLEQHQQQSIKHSAVSELQQGLMRVKAQVKDYESVIKQKHANYVAVIEAIEVQFQQAKAALVREVEEYLSNLVSKQHAHFLYLENKMKVHLRDTSLGDWVTTNRDNEAEMTAFFENIIKSPIQSTKDFSNEINSYMLSFRRNIQELDAQQNTKMLTFFTEELNSVFRHKFADLKQLLIMTAEDLPLRPTTTNMAAGMTPLPNVKHHNQQFPLNTSMNSIAAGQEFKFKNYGSINGSSMKSMSSSRAHQNNNISYGEDFSHGDFEEETVSTLQNHNNISDSMAAFNTSSPAIMKPSNNQLMQNQHHHHQQQQQTEKNPLHVGGICSMISFQENLNKKIIATGSTDTTIKFWQLESSSFDYIKTLRGHSAPVYALAKIEKENNIFLASASQNGELKIWNPILQGKELLASFQDHSDAILYIHLADDFLITGSMDKTVKIWNLDELYCSQTLNQDEAVTGLCYVQRDTHLKSLVSACGDGFRIWNQKKPGEYKLKSYNNKAHKKGVSCVAAVALNGIDIATAGRDGLIKLWNLDKGVCVSQLTGHTDTVYQLYSPMLTNSSTKRDLYSSSTDGTIKVWCPPEQQQQLQASYENGHKYNGQHYQLGQFIVFENHNFILTASNDSNIIKIITIT